MIYRFSHPEWLIDVPKPDLEAANGNIIIYGTEMCGALAAHALNQKGLDFLAYADSDERKHGKDYYGHTILAPNELQERYPDVIILIASSAYKAIKEKLIFLGFSDTQIFPCFSIFDGLDLSGFQSPWSHMHIYRNLKQHFITVLLHLGMPMEGFVNTASLILTDKCSLRCKGCSRRIPELENPSDYDADKMLQSIQNIMKAGFVIDVLRLTGGEPFLYKPLSKLINGLLKHPKINNIHVVTNCTLLPSDEMLRAFQNNRVCIRMSNYGELSVKHGELIALFEKNNIHYEDTKYSFWYEILEVNQQLSPEQLQSRFYNCLHHMRILRILEDKAYICDPALLTAQRGWAIIPEQETVDLTDTPDCIKRKLSDLLNRKEYHSGCRYCFISSEIENERFRRIPVAEQLP